MSKNSSEVRDCGGNYLSTGVATAFAYDGVGRRTSVTRDPDGLGLTTGFAYDGEGRLLTTTRPDGKSSTATYNFVGNRITATDEAARTTTYQYDAEARLASVSAPAQAKVEYVYDQASNLLKLRVNEDANRETDYQYDVLNRRTLERFPLGQGGRTERAYAYDASHNVSQYTDGRGVIVDLSNRDGVGRILSKEYTVPVGHPEIRDVPDVSYGYDSNGNLTGISNADGSASWSYDSLDRLNTESVASGPQITYGYDPRGVILSEAVASYAKLDTTHTYDAVGRRLTTVQDSQTTSFEWDDALRRTKVTLPNAVETAYTFDNIDRPTNIEYKKGTVFENYGYTYDDVGNPTAIVTNNGTYAYGYDSAYRLLTESRTGFRPYSASHTYDAMGNRLTRTLDGVTRSYSYNDADQVTGWTEGTKVGSYTYDIEGSVTQKVVTDGGTPTDQWDYEFDSVGRMDNGVQSVGGSRSTANVYAGDQWYRVSSTTGGTTLKYGWRQDGLFAEFDSGGQLTAGYLNDGVDRPFYKTRFSSDGSVVDGRDFYHGDANLRVHHVSDSSGNVAEKYVYNAYGRRTVLDASNNPLSSSAIGNRIGFQGREHEDLAGAGQEAGLTFHRNRFYDPDLGRWMRRDPIGNRGSKWNLYGFYDERPLRGIDPFGLRNPIIAPAGQIVGPEEMYDNDLECGHLNIQGLADASLPKSFLGGQRSPAFESGWRPKQPIPPTLGAWVDIDFQASPDNSCCCTEFKFVQIASVVGDMAQPPFIDIRPGAETPGGAIPGIPETTYSTGQHNSLQNYINNVEPNNPLPEEYDPDSPSRIRDYPSTNKWWTGIKKFRDCLFCIDDEYNEKPFLKVEWSVSVIANKLVAVKVDSVSTTDTSGCQTSGLPIGPKPPGGGRDKRPRFPAAPKAPQPVAGNEF